MRFSALRTQRAITLTAFLFGTVLLNGLSVSTRLRGEEPTVEKSTSGDATARDGDFSDTLPRLSSTRKSGR